VTTPTTLNVARPQAEGYGALFTYGADAGDNFYVQLAPSGQNPVRRATAPADQSGPNLAVNPEDFRPEAGRIFSRSQFSGGEGLARAHRADGNQLDNSRFWDSVGIRIVIPKPGEPEEILLAWRTETVPGSDAAAAPHVVKVADGGRVFWADGMDVKYSNNLLAASPTIVTEDPGVLAGGGSHGVTGLALDGKTLYAAMNGADGIHRRTWAGVWTDWSDCLATNVWSVKGRVLAAVGNVLYDAAAAAGSVELKTLAADDTWVDVVDAGHLILAAATDGIIYAFSDEAGSLILRGETPMRAGEKPTALGFADGVVFIGVADKTADATKTSGYMGRLYAAQLSGVRLRGSRLLREWGTLTTTLDHSPYRIRVTRSEVLVSVIDTDGKLAVFSYLLATAGTYRRFDDTAVVQADFVMVDESLVVFPLSVAPVREMSTQYAASGWMIFPYADWYSAAVKSVVGLRVENVAVPAAGAQIDLYYSTDPDALTDSAHASWTLGKSLTYAGDRSVEDEIPLLEVTGRGVGLMVKVTRSTAATASPKVRSVGVRAFEDLADILWELPVNVSDVLERPGKVPVRVNGRGEATYGLLRTYEGQPMQVELLRTGEKIKGRVESVSLARPVLTARGASMLVCPVTVRGVAV